MIRQVLIAHAEGEENLAEQLAVPIREAGYLVAHSGSVLVGESVIEEASKVLSLGGPVVLCGTVEALGTGWAHRIINAANQYNGVRIFAVQMQQRAYLNPLVLDYAVSRYWQDPTGTIQELISALKKYYPLSLEIETGIILEDGKTEYQEAHKRFLEQVERVEKRLQENEAR